MKIIMVEGGVKIMKDIFMVSTIIILLFVPFMYLTAVESQLSVHTIVIDFNNASALEYVRVPPGQKYRLWNPENRTYVEFSYIINRDRIYISNALKFIAHLNITYYSNETGELMQMENLFESLGVYYYVSLNRTALIINPLSIDYTMNVVYINNEYERKEGPVPSNYSHIDPVFIYINYLFDRQKAYIITIEYEECNSIIPGIESILPDQSQRRSIGATFKINQRIRMAKAFILTNNQVYVYANGLKVTDPITVVQNPPKADEFYYVDMPKLMIYADRVPVAVAKITIYEIGTFTSATTTTETASPMSGEQSIWLTMAKVAVLTIIAGFIAFLFKIGVGFGSRG
jgi:hypothetical protein